MVGIIKEIDGQKKIVPLTSDTGTGAPVGTLVSQYKKMPMSGYLYCDGSTFDENDYPALYMYLGTNVLPDYRECVMVGAEQNTTDTIATHDVYTQGEFKDDQLQYHKHVISTQNPGSYTGSYSIIGRSDNLGSTTIDKDTTLATNARSGETTHGKQKAVYVYIKATSGLAENQQENVLNDVKGYINSSNSYSTDEVKTGGKWIDGKPIYRKVLITTTLINGNEIGWGGLESNITSLNIDNCIASYAIIEHLGMRYLQYMPEQGGFISYYSGIPNDTKVVMEYTKTTD